jgi:lipoprotein NlpD
MTKPGIAGNRYTVVKGDTLYSIAFRSGMDVASLISINGITPPTTFIPANSSGSMPPAAPWPLQRSAGTYRGAPWRYIEQHRSPVRLSKQALAQRNNLQAPYALQVGRCSMCSPPAAAVVRWWQQPTGGDQHGAQTPGPAPQVRPHHLLLRKRLLLPRQQHTLRRKNKKPSVPTASYLGIGRPRADRRRLLRCGTGNKGIDISGQKGQPIYAASSGKVVYAGSALRGYGKLIILKHNDDYLSAYAHNDELRVKEETP